MLIIVAGVSIAGAAILIGNSGDTSPSTAIDLQKGLVGWWDFNGNAKDKTPYRRHGTVTGAVLANDRKGTANKAYSFNGTTDYISNGTSLVTLNSSFSISAWINIADITHNTYSIVGANTGNDIAKTYFIFMHRTDKSGLTFQWDNGAGSAFWPATASQNLTANTWTHAVVVFQPSANTVDIYQNGVRVTHDTAFITAPDQTTGQTWNIGSWGGTPVANFFNGSLDDIRIYNRALSAAEVTALYGEYNPGLQISDLQKGLVGQWKMDGNAKDSTPNRNHGTVNGAVVLTADRKTQTNKAYNFPGATNDYIQVKHNAAFSLNSTFTISVWFYASSPPSANFLGKRTGTGAKNYQLNLGGVTAHKLTASIGDSGSFTTITGGTTIDDGVWHHLVFTKSVGQLNLYVDGVIDATPVTETTTAITSTADLYFGQDGVNAGRLVGKLDDVRIYNRALTSAEITTLYQEYNPSLQISDLQKGLVGWWPLDGNAKDKTPYRTHMTVTGGAVLANDRKGEANKAYLLGSSSNYLNAASLSGFANPTTAITVAAWFKLNSNKNWNRIVERDSWVAAGKTSWLLFTASDGTAIFGVSDTTGTQYNAVSNAVSAGTWHHVVGTYDGTLATQNVKVYVNGSLGPTTASTPSATFSSITALHIGNNDATNFLDGFADDVRIWNRALTQTEVTALYQSY